MKKKIKIFIIIIILLTALGQITFTQETDESNSENSTIIDGTWTVLVHLSTDFMTDSRWANYFKTIESIERMDYNNRIKIVLMVDYYGPIPDYEDGYYFITGADDIKGDIVVKKGEINSGDPKEVMDFIDWAVLNYPSDNYLYMTHAHGGGFKDDLAFDIRRDDTLTYKDIEKYTGYLKSKIGKKIDLYYMKSCSMGGIELAYEIKNNANYLLFSEPDLPIEDHGSYEALEVIVNQSETTAKNLGISFTDSAYDCFTTTKAQRDFILALINLNKIDDLYKSIDNYAINTVQFIKEQSVYSIFNDIASDSFYPGEEFCIDIGSYFENVINSNDINYDIKNNAQNVLNELNACVEYRKDFGYPTLCGMYIFHNIYQKENYSSTIYRDKLTFSNNKWIDYVELLDNYYNNLSINPDQYESDNTPETAKNIEITDTQQVRNIHSKKDVDFICFEAKKNQNYVLSLDSKKDKYGNNYIQEIELIFNYLENNEYHQEIYFYENQESMFFSDYDTTCYIKVYLSKKSNISNCSYNISIKEFKGQDQYEYGYDYDFEGAQEITVNNSPQLHTFHDYWDKDNLYFIANSDKEYLIECKSIEKNLLTMFLYEEGNTKDYIAFGYIGKPIRFICEEGKKYYIKIELFKNKIEEYTIQIKTE